MMMTDPDSEDILESGFFVSCFG